jgi:hypothetical protein
MLQNVHQRKGTAGLIIAAVIIIAVLVSFLRTALSSRSA